MRMWFSNSFLLYLIIFICSGCSAEKTCIPYRSLTNTGIPIYSMNGKSEIAHILAKDDQNSFLKQIFFTLQSTF